MITTISMQIKPAPSRKTIPTSRKSPWSTAVFCLLIIIVSALLGAALVGQGLARSAIPRASGAVGHVAAASPDALTVQASNMRTDVQALHAFPEPYPASAAVAP